MKATTISFFVICSSLLLPPTARADIVVFKNGRTMSVKACRVDGDTATLRLREGGEVTFPAAIVARVDPDEVPYPEPGQSGPVASREPLKRRGARRSRRHSCPMQVLAARPYAELISTDRRHAPAWMRGWCTP